MKWMGVATVDMKHGTDPVAIILTIIWGTIMTMWTTMGTTTTTGKRLWNEASRDPPDIIKIWGTIVTMWMSLTAITISISTTIRPSGKRRWNEESRDPLDSHADRAMRVIDICTSPSVKKHRKLELAVLGCHLEMLLNPLMRTQSLSEEEAVVEPPYWEVL